MYIGVELLKAGKMLLPTSERSRKGGQPDLCVLDGERRIWIEATCPGTGADGPDQVRGPKPINEGGSFEPAPARQVDLRLTSALSTKQKAIERYLQEGVIAATDVRVVAICASRFSLYVSEWPIPGIMKAVFPIGDEYFRIDKQTGDVVGQGFHGSFEIPRQGPAIERNAFLTPQYAAISAIIWSRISVGNMSRAERPLTLVHNPIATVQFPTHWGVWDREFVTTPHPDAFTTTDILAKADRND